MVFVRAEFARIEIEINLLVLKDWDCNISKVQSFPHPDLVHWMEFDWFLLWYFILLGIGSSGLFWRWVGKGRVPRKKDPTQVWRSLWREWATEWVWEAGAGAGGRLRWSRTRPVESLACFRQNPLDDMIAYIYHLPNKWSTTGICYTVCHLRYAVW